MNVERHVKKVARRAIKIAAREGYLVQFWQKNWSEIWPRQKKIHISRTIGPRKAVFELLHELGHLVVTKNKFLKDLFPAGIRARESRRNVNKVDIWGEEILCWKLGLVLAKRLRIKISERGYTRHAASRISNGIISSW